MKRSITLLPTWIFILTLIFLGYAIAQEDNSAKTDEAASRLYATAVALQNREVYDLAAEEWRNFVSKFPNDPRVDRGYHYLGICYLKNQQFDQAIQTLNKVLRDYPKFALLDATYLYLGVAQYNLGRSGRTEAHQQAIQTFTKLLEKHPQSKAAGPARFYFGESLYALGKKEQAAAKYAELLQGGLQSELAADALYALGVCQQELGKTDQASQTYASFVKSFAKHPLVTEVSMRQGEMLLGLKRYAEAEKLFAAAAATPNFAHADFATLQYGASLSARQQYDEAAVQYRVLLKKFPQSSYRATAELELGKCAFLSGDYGGARKALTAAAGAGGAPGAEAAHWIVRSYLKEQQPAAALKTLEQVLPAAANTPFAVQLEMDRADVLYEIPERRAEAGTLYAAIAAKYPQDVLAPQAIYMTAFAALGSNEYRQSLDYSAKFLQSYAGHALEPDVQYIAAESRLQLQEYSQADELYQQLIKKYAQHADLGQWKVRSVLSLSLQKKFPETIAAAEAALRSLKTPALVAEAHYLAGNAQIELKQFDAAIRSLKASLKADPRWRQADETGMALALAFRQANNFDQARGTLQQLIEAFPQSALLDRAHYRLAEYEYAAKNYKSAADQYQFVWKKWPQSSLVPYAILGFGRSQLNQNDHASAAKALSELIERFPQHELTARGRYARALVRQQLKEYAPAMDDLNAYLKAEPSGPDAADARYVLGLCQAALGKHGDAVATYQTLLKDTPNYAGADKTMYELAWALKDQGNHEAAAEWFNRLAREHDNSPLAAESRFQTGEFAYQKQDYKRAAEDYSVVSKKAGKSELGEKAIYKLGWSLFRQERFDDANKSFALQRRDYSAGTLAGDAAFMQGECLFKQAKFSEAISMYGEVKNPMGKEFAALSLLHAGQAAAQLKDWSRSLQLLEQVARDFPDSEYVAEALYEQGWANQNLSKLDKALAFYKLVPEKTDREVAARAWFMSGEIYFEKKDHKEAIRCFLKTAFGYNYPEWQANAHYEAGRCFEAIGKKDQAIQSYREVTSKHAQSEKARLAQQRLDELSKPQ